jgi:hypothetical protein
MRFILNNGEMALQESVSILDSMRSTLPISTSLMVDVPLIKERIKDKSRNFLKTSAFAVAPITVGSKGVFWSVFLTYIFPWMLDIAKVYCAIRVAQAFYQEKRGGRDEGTGFGALVQYGKWYLVFWLIPWGVELIDQIGGTMFNDLQQKGVDVQTNTVPIIRGR